MNRPELKTISEFTDYVIRGLSDKLPSSLMAETEIRQMEVTKLNDTVLHGITFEQEGEDIAPTFYLDDPYKDYLEGEDPEVIITELAKCYLISLVAPKATIPLDPDFVTIKDHLALRVVNTNFNKAFLEGIPYRPVGFDLALICDIKMDDGLGGCWRAHVHSSFLDGESEETLFDHALANVKNIDPPVLRTTFLSSDPEQSVTNLLKSSRRIRNSEKESMYVVTTEGGYYGASAFFYPGIMKEVAEKLGESYYAIPSSVHEFIIIPVSSSPQVQVLQMILKEGNETPGCYEDRISEDVLYYDQETNILSIASDCRRS